MHTERGLGVECLGIDRAIDVLVRREGHRRFRREEVRREGRARDIERSLPRREEQAAADLQWTVSEMRQARAALVEIVALAHDIEDGNAIGQRIRFVANRALGLYENGKTEV